MDTFLIGCQIIEKELKQVMSEAGHNYPGVFFRPGLDTNPEDLKKAILAEMAKLPAPSRVLLGYGFSNGALTDLPAGPHQLVAPQAEDVLCLILGSQKRRDEIMKETPSYIITEGWLKGDNLFGEYKKAVEKYGPEKAARLQKMMLGGYTRFLLVDTGVYNLADYRDRFKELAAPLGMAVEDIPGDLSWLKRLVAGPPWDNTFVVAEPGQTLTVDPAAGSRG